LTLKILQVASHSDLTRGGAVQMLLLARGLKERGHDVWCVFNRAEKAASHCPTTPSPTSAALRSETAWAEQIAPLSGRLFNLGSLRDMLRFRAWVRSERFDVIHSHREPALRFCFLATLGFSVPAFVTQRGTVYRLPRWGVVRWAFRSPKLDRVIAVSEAVRRSLIANDGLAPDKVSVVYGGYDPQQFHRGIAGDRVRSEFGLDAQTQVVGIVGALIAKKGHADFFEAAARIAEAVLTARFLAIGPGKPERFAAMLEQLGLGERVIFAGYRSDIAEALAALDVLVCASTKGEGLTGAVREAMAVGTPVVTTDVGGNTELVEHERTGLVVPVGSPVDLARATLRLLGDSDEAARLADAAELCVRSLCLNSTRCERIEQIYVQIIEKWGRHTISGE